MKPKINRISVERGTKTEYEASEPNNISYALGRKGVRLDGATVHALFRDNRKQLTQRFGPHSFKYKVWGYTFWCWLVRFEDKTYYVLTAKDKGTAYERSYTSKRSGLAQDVRFLNVMLKLLA